MMGRVPFDSGSADELLASGSPARSSMMEESPVGFTLPSSDEVVRPGSKAEADTSVDPWAGSASRTKGPPSCGWGVAAETVNPLKMRSPRISAM